MPTYLITTINGGELRIRHPANEVQQVAEILANKGFIAGPLAPAAGRDENPNETVVMHGAVAQIVRWSQD